MPSRWTAWLAPLGVPSADGRVIDPAARIGHPAPPRHAYLTVPESPRPHASLVRLGVVDEVLVQQGWLTAGGTLFPQPARHEPLLNRLRSWDLVPEMALSHCTLADGSPVTFTSGIVAAVLAGDKPAWPGCRFILEESDV